MMISNWFFWCILLAAFHTFLLNIFVNWSQRLIVSKHVLKPNLPLSKYNPIQQPIYLGNREWYHRSASVKTTEKNLKKIPKKHLKTKIPKISETKFPYKKRKKLSKKTFQFFSNNKISIFFKLNFWPKISQQKYQNKKCLNKIVPCIQDDSHASLWLFVKPHLHPPWTEKNSCNVFLYGVIVKILSYSGISTLWWISTLNKKIKDPAGYIAPVTLIEQQA